jgi:hypothetical protein
MDFHRARGSDQYIDFLCREKMEKNEGYINFTSGMKDETYTF